MKQINVNVSASQLGDTTPDGKRDIPTNLVTYTGTVTDSASAAQAAAMLRATAQQLEALANPVNRDLSVDREIGDD